MLEIRALLKLRWLAAIGQTGLVLVGYKFFPGQIDLIPLLLCILSVLISNFFAVLNQEKLRRIGLASILIFDTTILTLLLYYSGGAHNPFSLFYVVHVALAAVLLGEFWTWIIALLSCLYFGLIFIYYHDVPDISSHTHHDSAAFSLHLEGMWVAFALVASILAFSFSKLLRSIKTRDERLMRAEIDRVKQERLALITYLAANAAHDLNTPLATITLAAGEIISQLRGSLSAPAIKEDVELILSEVDRCSKALNRFRVSAGDIEGALPQWIATEELARDIRSRLREDFAARVQVNPVSQTKQILAPKVGLTEALTALVKNGLEASAMPVTLSFESYQNFLRITVSDRGDGIPEEIKTKLGDPFITTKPQGVGLGLGVFLAKAFAERLGGRLDFSSLNGHGTNMFLDIPFMIRA